PVACSGCAPGALSTGCMSAALAAVASTVSATAPANEYVNVIVIRFFHILRRIRRITHHQINGRDGIRASSVWLRSHTVAPQSVYLFSSCGGVSTDSTEQKWGHVHLTHDAQ